MSEQKKTTSVKLRASKKLNAKKLFGDVKSAIIAAGGKPDQLGDDGRVTTPANWVELFRVVGTITGLRTGTTQYGAWISFTGDDLAALNSVTGEVYKGRELLLPDEATILLEDPVKNAVLAGASLKVALSIEAQITRSTVGYMYRVVPLMPIEISNSVAMRMLLEYGGEKAALALPMLAAPVVTDVEPDTPETEPVKGKQKTKVIA